MAEKRSVHLLHTAWFFLHAFRSVSQKDLSAIFFERNLTTRDLGNCQT